MSEPLYRLRYVAGAHHDHFRSIRYPLRHGVTRDIAERMRAAMPDPELLEICEEGN